MINKAMQEKLDSGECVDVLKIGREVSPGLYELDRFEEDVDYCDAEKELWIWSIGRRHSDNKVFASTDGRFYLNDEYHCLWLR